MSAFDTIIRRLQQSGALDFAKVVDLFSGSQPGLVNLDAMTTPGRYNLKDGMTNGPAGVFLGVLEVLSFPSVLIQNLTDTDGKVYSRRQNVGFAFGSWLSAVPSKGTGVELAALTDDTKFLTAKAVADSIAPSIVSPAAGSTVTLDFAAKNTWRVNLPQGLITFGTPTGIVLGGRYSVHLVQNWTSGGGTVAFNAFWDFNGNSPTPDTAAARVMNIGLEVTALNAGGATVSKATCSAKQAGTHGGYTP